MSCFQCCACECKLCCGVDVKCDPVMTPGGICASLVHANRLSPDTFRRRLRYAAENLQAIFDNGAYMRDADEETMELIIRNDRCDIAEIEVFRAVLNWGRAQARKRGEQVTPVNVRPKIANLLKAVRFPFMAYEELSGEVKDSEVLDPDELVEIFVYKGTMKDQAEEKVRTRFPTQPRIGAFHRMERWRAEYREREAKAIRCELCFHWTQTPAWPIVMGPCIFTFAILIIIKQDPTQWPGLPWWGVFAPLLFAGAFIVYNLLSLYYFKMRDTMNWCGDNRGLWCYHGVFQAERGPCADIFCHDHRPANSCLYHGWLLTAILCIVAFFSLLTVYQFTDMDVKYVFVPIWIIYCMIPFMSCCVFNSEYSRGSENVLISVALTLMNGPFFSFVFMLYWRVTGHYMPVWGLMMPWIIFAGILTLGSIVFCLVSFAKLFSDDWNKTEDFLVWMIGCAAFTPFLLFIIFICLWGAARDSPVGESVGYFTPTLIEALAPLICYLIAMLIGSGVLGLILSEETCRRARRAPGPLPAYLLEHQTMPTPV